jgi:hypothetical protein
MAAASTIAAPVRYSYSGNLFTSFEEGIPTGVTALSGFFVVSEALGPNFGDEPGSPAGGAAVFPIAFEFADGLNSISDTDAIRFVSFSLRTDASGSPITWFIRIEKAAFSQGDYVGIGSLNEQSQFQLPDFDRSSYCAMENPTGSCSSFSNPSVFPAISASNESSPGSWTIAVIPIPTVGFLFPSGLLVGLAWMKRRAA